MNAGKRLERELTLVLTQLRQLDAATPADVVDASTHERLVERVERLHDALDRVEDGTYGRCAECDAMIDTAHLRESPEAETCRGCAQRRDQLTPSRRQVA